MKKVLKVFVLGLCYFFCYYGTFLAGYSTFCIFKDLCSQTGYLAVAFFFVGLIMATLTLGLLLLLGWSHILMVEGAAHQEKIRVTKELVAELKKDINYLEELEDELKDEV